MTPCQKAFVICTFLAMGGVLIRQLVSHHIVSTDDVMTRPKRDLVDQSNVALSMMTEFAQEINYTNCWICQNIPHSAQASMLRSIPFSIRDWRFYNWHNLIHAFDTDPDCFAPLGRETAMFGHLGKGTQARLIYFTREVNKRGRPMHFNMTRLHRLLRVTYDPIWIIEATFK